jgi:hypothetical protein
MSVLRRPLTTVHRERIMCDPYNNISKQKRGIKTIPVTDAVGMALAHDVTEIRSGEFKGRAFRKGHIVKSEDICHFQRLGKENLFVLSIGDDEMHEDEAARVIAEALMGDGVMMQGEPREGKINIVASRDGLLKIDTEALLSFNMLGDVMCATLHNMLVKKEQIVAGTRAVPLVIKRDVVEKAVLAARNTIRVRELRKPRAGVVITGNEVYYGRIKDAFAPIIERKIKDFNGEIIGIYYAPDDEKMIEDRLAELIDAGADLLITTGGMSVDPDDVTRFAITKVGAVDMTYGSAVLPGAMLLVAYLRVEARKNESSEVMTENSSKPTDLQSSDPSELPILGTSELIPVLGIPACGMYHKTTVLDLIFPRVLAGERIGRRELSDLGHGGLCMSCSECRYPACPFGKG